MKKFTLWRVYNEGTTGSETVSSIADALAAAAIYVEDPDCLFIKIWDDTGKLILDYSKEG